MTKEEKSQYNKLYRKLHREQISKKQKEWRQKNSVNDREKERYKNDPQYSKKRREQVRMSDLRLRQKVIEAYGGKCEVCGITELRFLTLDHSFQNGAEHRRRLADGKVFLRTGRSRSTTKMVYRDIIRRGFPKDEGYRVLCWNHNCGGAWLSGEGAE